MSWIERIQRRMSITTGDGIVYFPEYMNAVLEQEYNVSEFNFPDVDGTLVKRRSPRGRRFALEIHFTGENNIDIAEDFRLSTVNKKAWTIDHPLYDEVIVQPRKLRFDNSKMNVTKITGLVLETISNTGPTAAVAPIDEILSRKVELDRLSSLNYSNQIDNLQASEIAGISDNILVIESTAEDIILIEDEKVNYKNEVLKSQAAIVNIIQEPLNAIRSIQSVINFPFSVTNTVEARVSNLIEQFDRVLDSFANIIPGISRNDKVYLETQGANTISAAAAASVSNIDDFPYGSREDVDNISLEIISAYNDFIVTIDGFQTVNQTEEDSYAPNPDVMTALEEIINFTLSMLDEIALESQQEHIIINEADNNAIILSHRVYGPDSEDTNLERFISTNKIGLNEILLIPKGKELIYFV